MIAPVLTATSAPPSVKIVFAAAALSASVRTITVYRVVDGVASSVRSGINLYAVGGAVVSDHEAPIGVSVEYRARQFDIAGNDLGYTLSASTMIEAEGGPFAWLSDPLDTTSAIRVILADNAGVSPSRPTPGTLHRVGARTVALVGLRGLREGLNMDFYTETDDDRDAVEAIIDQTGGLILIRTAPPIRIPRLLYCWASNPVPDEFDPFGKEGTTWTNQVDEVSPSEGGVVVGALTWQVYMDAYPLWSDFNAAYLTWLDAMKSPPIV